MKYIADIKKYKRYGKQNTIVLLLFTQGLWALFYYRIFNFIYRSKLPFIIKKTILFLYIPIQKIIEIITGISIPYSATIGKSFYIGHFGHIIIHPSTIIGNNCNISQGVTIGVSGKGEKRGVPKIGNNVYIGANSVIAGKIKIVDNVVIGACSLVVDSILEEATVLGVPAKKINNNNSKNYI
ncbi:serine acetyltransferase [Polaribacter batillariae]|uniref:Serine acetyltransferase n=1 Tax=Polaribacter batillariae TaxID=2808900 RepID=A0ABX7SUL1_9FLAO|nr:serine acetyltransferase [Polaribacter batillariae]QTD37572.1 serine acetyltransferase [Polaribacter batillariae]